MRHNVPAPEGYEACVCYNRDADTWEPYYKKVGNWANKCISFGHSGTPDDEVIARAAEIVQQAIVIHAGLPGR